MSVEGLRAHPEDGERQSHELAAVSFQKADGIGVPPAHVESAPYDDARKACELGHILGRARFDIVTLRP